MARRTGRIIRVDHYFACDAQGGEVAEFTIHHDGPDKWTAEEMGYNGNTIMLGVFPTHGEAVACVKSEATKYITVPNPSTADRITALHRELDEYAGD